MAQQRGFVSGVTQPLQDYRLLEEWTRLYHLQGSKNKRRRKNAFSGKGACTYRVAIWLILACNCQNSFFSNIFTISNSLHFWQLPWKADTKLCLCLNLAINWSRQMATLQFWFRARSRARSNPSAELPLPEVLSSWRDTPPRFSPQGGRRERERRDPSFSLSLALMLM